MLAIEVEYLLRRSVATRHDDRTAAEWPPHPGRLFSALVAAYGERGGDPSERDALEWLERQVPPWLSAPGNLGFRDAVPVFVPVNDSTTGHKVLPRYRPKALRHFPAAIPDGGTVFFIWPSANGRDLARHRPALERLTANLTYLGHSSSVVRAVVCDAAPPPTLRPADGNEAGDMVLRVPGVGRLRRLVAAHELSLQVKRRIEPPLGELRPYLRVGLGHRTDTPQSAFGGIRDWIVFQRVSGPKLPLHASLQLNHKPAARRLILAPLSVRTGEGSLLLARMASYSHSS